MAQYVLVECSSQPSRLNSVTMWRLTFYSLEDGQVYEMTVDSSYRNFRRNGWDHVVESDTPWGVYSGMRRTDRVTREGIPVVTADGTAELIYRCESRAEALELMAADHRERTASTTYGSFFQ
jgi:hypothetical protein